MLNPIDWFIKNQVAFMKKTDMEMKIHTLVTCSALPLVVYCLGVAINIVLWIKGRTFIVNKFDYRTCLALYVALTTIAGGMYRSDENRPHQPQNQHMNLFAAYINHGIRPPSMVE